MYNNIYEKFTYYFRSIFVDDNVINRIKVLEKNLENTNQNSSKIQKNYTEQLNKFEKNLRTKMDIIENNPSMNVNNPIYNVSKTFNPGYNMGPWSGFVTKIDTESILRNQIYQINR